MVLAKWDVQAKGNNDGNLVPVFTLHDYLTQDFQLSIPPWQREYMWDSNADDGEISQLMEDLKGFVESDDLTYLLGAVILCDTSETKRKFIIDGQQRTVTLTLFLMCAFKYLTKELEDMTDHVLLTELERTFNRGSRFAPLPSVAFAQDRADSVMQHIRAWLLLEGTDADKHLREIETYSQTQKNLLAVVRYFSKGLSSESWFNAETIKTTLWKILSGVSLLQLNLDNQREAIRVYDRINNRGRHLSGGDLVKNLMFEKVEDDRFEEINENWTMVVEILRHLSSSKMQEPTFLLRQLAWGYRQGKTTYDQLPDFFVDYFNAGGPKGNVVDPVEFSRTFVDSAEALEKFGSLRHRRHGDLPLLEVPRWLGVVQHYAILLAGEGLRDKAAFIELYEQVATRTMLYAFAQERTPDFETLVNVWAHQVHLAGPEASKERIQEIFATSVGYPQAMLDQLRVSARNWSYQKSSERKRIRASLSLMSWWLDGQSSEDNGSIDQYFRTRKRKGQKHGWDLDHVEAQGSSVLGLTDEEKNSFGNLVLLHHSDNRGAKNATAAQKKSEYEQSKIILTKSLVAGNYPDRMSRKIELIKRHYGAENDKTLEQWGSDAIASRTAFYAAFLEGLVTRSLPAG